MIGDGELLTERADVSREDQSVPLAIPAMGNVPPCGPTTGYDCVESDGASERINRY